MRVSLLDYAAVPVAFTVARWFQPPAVVAVILTLTLVVTLRRAEQLRSWRQLWIVVALVGSGLTVVAAFLTAVQWMTKMGVF